MTFTFSIHGHVIFPPTAFATALEGDLERLCDDVLMVGTPFVFPNYKAFCDFTHDLGAALGVHPRNLYLRGSARFGYSTTPRTSKLWGNFRALTDTKPSDIDVAIIDSELFNNVNRLIIRWEERRTMPSPNQPHSSDWLRRRELRGAGMVYSKLLPPRVFSAHVRSLKSFDTTPYIGGRRTLTTMIFRDAWAFRKRWIRDLREIKRCVDNGCVPGP